MTEANIQPLLGHEDFREYYETDVATADAIQGVHQDFALPQAATSPGTFASPFTTDGTRLPDVQSFITVFKELLAEGLQGDALRYVIVESVSKIFSVSHAMICTRTSSAPSGKK